MKKIIITLFLCTWILNIPVVLADKAKQETTSSFSIAEQQKNNKLSKMETDLLIARLHEIRKMDTREMTDEQKKQLRNEVITIRERLKKSQGVYIYLSGGAIIIILLLIILL